MRRVITALASVLLLAAVALAADISGTVTNGTTGKPAAGVEVTLLKLSNGMEEAGSTRTDAQGRYTLPNDDPQAPHLVRVVYQDVNYMQPAPPGSTSADLSIYDASKQRFDGIKVVAHVLRFQAQDNQMQVAELYAVQNTATPPRTWMNDRTFAFNLPKGAQVDNVNASGPGGMPIRADAPPTGVPNQYAFSFPIRPGETKLQIEYRLPYSGKASFDARPLDPTQHVVVMLPKSMTFTPRDASQFQQLSEEQNSTVMVASNVSAGQTLPFTVSGTGLIQQESEQGTAAAGGGTGGEMQVQPDNRPGGGLGRPEDTPDPLSQYRWPILIGFGVLMLAGGFFVVKRQPQLAPVANDRPLPSRVAASQPAASSDRLLEAMKDELFELEIERQQGKITPQEYEKAKAALDQTIARALSRRKGQGTA